MSGIRLLSTCLRVSCTTVASDPGPPAALPAFAGALWATLLAAVLLAGCGRDKEEGLLYSSADGTPVALTYVAPDFSALSLPERAAIERFEERAPGIEIDRQTLGRDVSAYLLDASPPDVMLLWSGYTLRAAGEQGLLADLTEIWRENGFAEAYGERFRELSRFEGTPRFLPGGFSWAGIYYNKELFARYGIDPPATWEEFLLICDALLANGETPLSVAGQNPFISLHWFDYLNLRLNGPAFHRDLVSGRVSYHDERVATVLETWLSLLERGYFTETPGQTSEIGSLNALVRTDSENPLTREKAVMALVPHYSVGQLPPVFASELDFFQFPQMDPDVPLSEITVVIGYAIPDGALQRPEADIFVAYLGSAEAQGLQMGRIAEEATNVGYVPVHGDVEGELVPAAARKGGEMVRAADELHAPFFLAVPDSMQPGLFRALRLLFLRAGAPVKPTEVATILEEARQAAIQSGEYRP